MIINNGKYNYHGVVKTIYNGVDATNNLKYAVIKAYGRCEVDDPTKDSGKRMMKQDMTIFCRSGLACYVESEIDEGDKILVVGQIITKQKSKGNVFYYEQCIQAEEVYKNEWVKYYG